MEYIPTEYQKKNIPEANQSDIYNITTPTIVRNIQIIGYKRIGKDLLLYSSNLILPLQIPSDAIMMFGEESISALTYFTWVMEFNDLIDAVVLYSTEKAIRIQIFWIHIRYVGHQSQARTFSKKDDGLFAMRTKSGEKAERLVTRNLITKGHRFPNGLIHSPGVFIIYYQGKGNRKPDRRCLNCGLTFEVKKRNRDNHFRVSHSSRRPFHEENNSDGWHAIVFPDMTIHYLKNSEIANAISKKEHQSGEDIHDKWTDVDQLVAQEPPECGI
jgi:hypothetical protein